MTGFPMVRPTTNCRVQTGVVVDLVRTLAEQVMRLLVLGEPELGVDLVTRARDRSTDQGE